MMTEQIKRALANTGITQLNAMQQAVLDADATKDLVLLSPTGSGKTLAFLLPLLTALTDDAKQIQALIVAPSRELALQIETVFRSLGAGYKVNCCYGGHPIRTEKKSLEHPPTVLIGTPGRLVDHLERETIDLSTVHTLVLDEFDKTLELGFLREMKEILGHLPRVRRRVLTSATESLEIPHFIGLKSTQRLSFLSEVKETKGLKVYQVQSPERDKLHTLYRLLGELDGASALVFCNLREAVERVSHYLTEKGVSNEYFHGGKEQTEREKALAYFRNGSATVFISTDLAARGLDIPDVQCVIHYHLPLNEEAYIHRNGRTARMEHTGSAFLIVNDVEAVPEYLTREPEAFFLPAEARTPRPSPWTTLTINRGKRDKLSRGDIAGFLMRKGELQRDDLGVIEVRESCTYVAVKRDKRAELLRKITGEKVKNMNAKYY